MILDDEFYMRASIAEANASSDMGEVPIGAVVVTGSGRIVGRGHNLTETLGDATAHAEMQALTAAMAATGSKYLRGCTIYVTVEPCMMCAGALMWSQIGRLVYGASDPKRGFSRYKGRLHPQTQVRAGVLEKECSELVSGFFEKLR